MRATANHTKRGRRARKSCVCMCVRACAHACIRDFRKFRECKNRNIRGEAAESIISYITAPAYHMTICGPSAERPARRLERAFIYFGCLRVNIWSGLGRIQICKKEEAKCLNSQWKEVGREEREERRETPRQKGKMNGKNEWMTEPQPHT